MGRHSPDNPVLPLFCKYGCGQLGVHVFRNGTLCCCSRFEWCPAYRQRMSERTQGEGNPFYGKRHSELTKAGFSETRQGPRNSFYGRQHTERSKRLVSKARVGQHAGSKNPIFGKPRPEDVRRKISETRVQKGIAKGQRNPNWRHGNTKPRKAEMSTTRYKAWRQQVLVRDDYMCVLCGQRGCALNADHIKPWAYFPDLRYDVTNGRTLCVPCHRTTLKEVFRWRDTLR